MKKSAFAGASDTGVDTDSCFFYDSNVSLPNCSGYGYVNTSGCINNKHRKIVSYVSAPSGSPAQKLYLRIYVRM